jgi:hypothetical protein
MLSYNEDISAVGIFTVDREAVKCVCLSASSLVLVVLSVSVYFLYHTTTSQPANKVTTSIEQRPF